VDGPESPDRFGQDRPDSRPPDTTAKEPPPKESEPTSKPDPVAAPPRDRSVTVRGSAAFLAGIDPSTLPPVRAVVDTAEKRGAGAPLVVEGTGPLVALRVAGAGSVLLFAAPETETGAGAWLEYPALGKFLAQALRTIARVPRSQSPPAGPEPVSYGTE